MKSIKIIAPVILAAAGVAVCPATPPHQQEEDSVMVNPKLVAICTRAIPFFGAAFAGEPSARTGQNFGIPVTFVKDGTPAAGSGIKAGDVLLTFDGQKIFFPNQFSALLRIYKPGDVASIEFLRDGKIIQKKVTLAARGGNAVPPRAENSAVPAPTDEDDIRLVVNGKEIILSQNGSWRERISITPDAVIIRTTMGVPEDLRRVVDNFRRRIPEPQKMAAEFKMEVHGAKQEFFKKTASFEQVFFGGGKTVILFCENNLRTVTVRDGEREIFRGPCSTQKEIDEIPKNALEIINEFTELSPTVINVTESAGTRDAATKKK